ncbi:ammonium transporter [Oerskovia enterophila]|uniref:Ammonium transporter n=1 Tax=Oerskovia enterophila TaxID=43678 RepID=A0ABX2Y0D9_9CELL|nr:ammonium transporter [Oerskovia enterophila]OCI29926.1 ammonia channel precursor [Oerskovia enterophila]
MSELVIDSGDTVWVLVSAALVLFMMPGLALFYAGLVRRGNVLAIMQQNLVPIAVITLTWILVGYSIAFSDDIGNGFMGDLGLFGLTGLDTAPTPALHAVDGDVAIPTLAFVAFQMMFAIITPALLTGATVGRLKTVGWVVTLALWSVLVYPFVAHWLFNPDGWLVGIGAQDWAGGIVVHAAAGAAALAVLVVVGRRQGWPRAGSIPHSIPLAVAGAGILWFGWFGFNGGGSLQGNGVAAQALLNTHVAGAAAMAAWLLMERLRTGKGTVIGAVTGGVAGLATITPCAGYVSTLSALVIGLAAGVVCTFALGLKTVFRFDDALDVIAVHFVGGILGSLLLGLFGSHAINAAGVDGLFFGGGADLLVAQVIALVVVIAFSFVVTLLIALAVQKTVGLKVAPGHEFGMDEVEQGANAYTLGQVSGLSAAGSAGGPGGSGTLAASEHPAPGEPGTAAPTGAPGAVVLTATFDSADLDTLTTALEAAGAWAIQVTEVDEVVADPPSLRFRESSQRPRFARRLRVELCVAQAASPAVVELLSRQTVGLRTPLLHTLVEAPRA